MNIQINIENFKSIKNSRIELKPGLNILIGPNGAGKTNIMSSLKFLRDTLTQGVGLAIAKGGGPSRNYYRGKDVIKFQISLDYGQRKKKKRKYNSVLKWSLEIAQKGKEKIATIIKERIEIEYFKENEPLKIFELEYNRNNIEKPISSINFYNREYIGKDFFERFLFNNKEKTKDKLFEELEENLKKISNEFKKNGDRSFLAYLERYDYKISDIISFFSGLNEYNIIPNRARLATEQLPYSKMEPDGYGLSEVIDTLRKSNFRKLQYSYFNDNDRGYGNFEYDRFYRPYQVRRNERPFISALENINKELSAAVKPIISIDIDIDPTNGRRFVVFKSKDYKFFPDEVSDGTIKWVCIITSIFVGFSRIFLLEEPENFLHPWMQQKLVQIIREQSKLDNSIYILTSHSTTLLNSAYPNEVIVVSQNENGSRTDWKSLTGIT